MIEIIHKLFLTNIALMFIFDVIVLFGYWVTLINKKVSVDEYPAEVWKKSSFLVWLLFTIKNNLIGLFIILLIVDVINYIWF